MLPRLLIITNAAQAAEACGSLEAALEASLRAGARFIQLREKELSLGELRELAGRVVPLAHRFDAKIVINTHADIAADTGADGVHRPADGLPVGEIRNVVGDDVLVGISTHSLDEAERAAREGADYVTFSPIFKTASKPGYGPPHGLDELARVCEALDVPVFALAGVTPERARECIEAGAYGVAVMGGVMGASEPGGAVEAYLAAL